VKSVSQTTLINNNHDSIGEAMAPKPVRLYVQSLKTATFVTGFFKSRNFVERLKRTFQFKSSSGTVKQIYQISNVKCSSAKRNEGFYPRKLKLPQSAVQPSQGFSGFQHLQISTCNYVESRRRVFPVKLSLNCNIQPKLPFSTT
jgi:hypothetical protein